MVKNVVVIGAGIMGLSAALNIQERIPGSKVKVIAENFDTEVTSYGSGGIVLGRASNEPAADFRRWREASFVHFQKLATGPEACRSGAILINGYIMSKREDPIDYVKPYPFHYRKMRQDEIRILNLPEHLKHCYHVTTFIVDQSKYLKWLMKRISLNGGEFENRKVKSLEEFVGRYDVVVNCAGLGSRELVHDPEVYAKRGQVVRVKAPWIKTFFMNADDETQIMPGEQFVSLGSVMQKGREDLEPDLADTAHILDKCTRLAHSLKGASIDHVWVGLRPCRDKIRLEAEDMSFQRGQLKVVHNYGHGTSGVALSWGTSMEVADLVGNCLAVAASKL